MSHYVKHLAYYQCDCCSRREEVWYEGSVKPPLPLNWRVITLSIGDLVEACSDLCEFRLRTQPQPTAIPGKKS